MQEVLNKSFDLAVQMARAAGKIQRDHLGRLKEIKLKGVSNLLTEVDLACEKLIIEKIKENFPDHAILSEEKGHAVSSTSGWQWIIDPLDGTTNYAHAYPHFCVSIALAKDGKLELGVVYNPVMDELFHAVRGSGAFMNGEPIRVSEIAELKDALLCTGFAYDVGKRLGRDFDMHKAILPHAQSLRRDGSAALDICYVACGRFDGFWELNLNPWDIAAGSLIVEQAGGRWSDIRGNAMPLTHPEYLCTNGKIHDEVVALMKGL